MTDENKELRCSFCGKSRSEVKKLIAGPTVYICNECVDICAEILDDDQVQRNTPTGRIIRYLERGRSDLLAATQLMELGHQRVAVDVARSAAQSGLRAFAVFKGSDPRYETFAVLLNQLLEQDDEFRRLHGLGATHLIIKPEHDDEVSRDDASSAIAIAARVVDFVAATIDAA